MHFETVYQLIYADKAANGDLYKHLRITSKSYRKRYGSYDNRGRIKNRTNIDDRPNFVESRSSIGDWEGDTIIGKGRQSAMLILIEQKTLYGVIVRLTGKRADLLAESLIQEMKGLKSRIKTITFDNGLEFDEHQRIAGVPGAKIHFAHPDSSWELGTNENTNGVDTPIFPQEHRF